MESMWFWLFDRFAKAAIQFGRLRVILPNGDEACYGSGDGIEAPVPEGACAWAAWGCSSQGKRRRLCCSICRRALEGDCAASCSTWNERLCLGALGGAVGQRHCIQRHGI
jgi:hypothetical protein